MQYLIFDTNLLGHLCHPSHDRFKDFKQWAFTMLQKGFQNYKLCLPEIADYELRRKLIHIALQQGKNETNSLKRLNDFHEIFEFLPIQTSTLRLAAKLWAEARHQGMPTAQPGAIDGDVILAAQAKEKNGIVLTTNKKHLSRFVPVADWQSYQI